MVSMNVKMTVKKKKLLFVLLLLCLFACAKKHKIYHLAGASTGTSYYLVGKNIADLVSSQNQIHLEAMVQAVEIAGDTLALNSQNNCRIWFFNGYIIWIDSGGSIGISPITS